MHHRVRAVVTMTLSTAITGVVSGAVLWAASKLATAQTAGLVGMATASVIGPIVTWLTERLMRWGVHFSTAAKSRLPVPPMPAAVQGLAGAASGGLPLPLAGPMPSVLLAGTASLASVGDAGAVGEAEAVPLQPADENALKDAPAAVALPPSRP